MVFRAGSMWSSKVVNGNEEGEGGDEEEEGILGGV